MIVAKLLLMSKHKLIPIYSLPHSRLIVNLFCYTWVYNAFDIFSRAVLKRLPPCFFVPLGCHAVVCSCVWCKQNFGFWEVLSGWKAKYIYTIDLPPLFFWGPGRPRPCQNLIITTTPPPKKSFLPAKVINNYCFATNPEPLPPLHGSHNMY